jgi:hypothetical protein
MSMLAGQVDVVIGVDTHRDTNTAALVDATTSGVIAHTACSTDALGYKRLLAFTDKHGHGRRVWAIEGSGSYGAGLTTFLLERGEWVVEIDRPGRPARRVVAPAGQHDRRGQPPLGRAAAQGPPGDAQRRGGLAGADQVVVHMMV